MSRPENDRERAFRAENRKGPETIYALSSGLACGPGRAGVAVVRVSGDKARPCIESLCSRLPEPRRAMLAVLRRPEDNSHLDQALVLWFPAPHSFTGEDVAEFHIHGGQAVIAALLDTLGRIEGMRLAEPGEFARRAFENGKLDLTAAEGLSDLINAQTESQRVLALKQAIGLHGGLFEAWRQTLLTAQVMVEASIDFSDEGDVGHVAVDLADNVGAMVRRLHEDIGRHLADGHRGEIIRDGFRVVIMGPPNAGKSSLLNALAKRDVAIVSEEAGTTRDVIEVALDLGGMRVCLSDTAGIRKTAGTVEREGISRALRHAAGAQLVLWLDEAPGKPPPLPPPPLPEELASLEKRLLRITSKGDLLQAEGSRVANELVVSALTGQGLEELEHKLGALAQAQTAGGESAVITRARHRQELERAHRALGDFLAGAPEDVELRAEDLRLAARALGRITGHVDVEEILGQIFSEFCIGK